MNVIPLTYLHIVSVAASFALLFVRGMWVLRSLPAPQEPWIRALPYIIDSILILTALAVMVAGRANGWPGEWMTVKLLLIVLYVLTLLFLFGFGRSVGWKLIAWVFALLLVLFITTVSVLRNPLGIFFLL